MALPPLVAVTGIACSLAPAETIPEITLLQALQKGTYRNCRIVYNCYTLDSKSTLNSGDVKIEINSY